MRGIQALSCTASQWRSAFNPLGRQQSGNRAGLQARPIADEISFSRFAALVSASLEGCELGLENTGLIGGAAIGQDAGLVVKFLFAVVLNGAVAKVMCHRGHEQRTLFSTEQKYSSTFRLQHNGHVFKNLLMPRMYPAELFELSRVTGTALDAR